MAVYTRLSTNQIVNNILIDIVNNVPSINDINVGSVLRQIVEATGLEIDHLYDQLDNIYAGTRIDTSTDKDLENLGALVGIIRKSGTSATGFVTFSRLTPIGVNFVIPAGSIISTRPNTGEEQLRYIVVNNTTFEASITGETQTYIDGFYDYKLNERFISSITSLNGFVSALPYAFVENSDFTIIENFKGTIVDPDSVVIADNCDSIIGWNNTVDADAPTLDAVNFRQGSASLNLGKSGIATTSASYYKTITPVIDVQNLKLFVWVYIDNATVLADINYIDFYYGNISSANSFRMRKLNADLVIGWNQYLLNPFDNDTVITGVPNSSIIDYIEIDIRMNTNTDTFALGNIKMDFWAFGTDKNYEGDIIRWELLGTRPDDASIWTINYIPLSKEVLCRSEDVGAKFNVGRHKIIYKVTGVTNIDNVENFVSMEGGVNRETDDDLRERIKLAAEVVGNATVTALQQAVLGVNGVTSVSVDDTPTNTVADEPHIYDSGITDYKLDNEVASDNATLMISDTIGGLPNYTNGVDYVLINSTIKWLGVTTPINGATFYVTYDYEWIGHVHLFVAGSVTPLQPSVIADIETAIEETRAAGVIVTYAEPTPVIVNVSVVITVDTTNGYTFSAVSEAVEDALIQHLNTLGVGVNVYIAELYSVIQNVEGIINSSISLPAADVIINTDEIARAGTITIT